MLMMPFGDIQRHIERLTYRHGWLLHAWEHPFEGHYLTVMAVLPDAYNPEPLTVTINVPLPPMPSPEYLDHWLQWRLALIENHESREYLRRHDKPVFDPHVDGANDPPYKAELAKKLLGETDHETRAPE